MQRAHTSMRSRWLTKLLNIMQSRTKLALLVSQTIGMLNSLLGFILDTHRLGQSELFLMLCKVVIDLAGLIIRILMIFAELCESAPLLLQFCLQHANPLSLKAQQLHDRPEDHGCLASACPGTSGHTISHCRALHSSRAVDDHMHARQTSAL